MVETDISNIWGRADFRSLLELEEPVHAAHQALTEHAPGWLHLPSRTSMKDLDEIGKAAMKICRSAKALVIVGSGGCALGARAAITFMNGCLQSETASLKVYYAGDHLSSRAMIELMNRLDMMDFSVIAVSPLGTDIEMSTAFRMLRYLLSRKYGADAPKHVYVCTNPTHGPLRHLADEEGCSSFPLPADIEDRCSVFTACGLLPMAAAGIDIRALMAGARSAERELAEMSMDNPAWTYAAARCLMEKMGMKIERMVSGEPWLSDLLLWWQQLCAENEGRDGGGILPLCGSLPGDINTMGQLLTEGGHPHFETLLSFDADPRALRLETDWKNLDEIGALSGKTFSELLSSATEGLINALVDEGIPVILLSCGQMNAASLGYLFYFLELSSALSAGAMGFKSVGRPGADRLRQEMDRAMGL